MKMTSKKFSEIEVGQKFIEGNGNYFVWSKMDPSSAEHSETGERVTVNACIQDVPWFASFFPDEKVVILCESEAPA